MNTEKMTTEEQARLIEQIQSSGAPCPVCGSTTPIDDDGICGRCWIIAASQPLPDDEVADDE